MVTKTDCLIGLVIIFGLTLLYMYFENKKQKKDLKDEEDLKEILKEQIKNLKEGCDKQTKDSLEIIKMYKEGLEISKLQEKITDYNVKLNDILVKKINTITSMFELGASRLLFKEVLSEKIERGMINVFELLSMRKNKLAFETITKLLEEYRNENNDSQANSNLLSEKLNDLEKKMKELDEEHDALLKIKESLVEGRGVKNEEV